MDARTPEHDESQHAPDPVRRKRDWQPRKQRGKYKVLEMLSERNGCTLGELAGQLALSEALVGKLIHSLAASGLVRNAEQDARQFIVTGNGRRVLTAAYKERKLWLERNRESAGGKARINGSGRR